MPNLAAEEMAGPEWLAWRQQPQMQQFLALLRASIQTVQAEWLEARFLSSDPHQTMVNNMLALGHARGWAQVVSAIENIKLKDDDGEQVGIHA